MSFLLFTFTGWDEPPRARHQVAQALTRHGPVLFVEKNRVGPPGLSTTEVSAGLTLLTPSWPLDYRLRYRLPGINEAYQDWLLGRLKREHPEPLVICFDHSASRLSRHYPDYVYFCNDDFVGNSRLRIPLVTRYHTYTEGIVASRARLVVATSIHLADKLRRLNPNTHEIRLGAPTVTDDFIAAHEPPHRPGRRVLGLLGFIDHRVPTDVLNRLLAQPDTELVLIGPMAPGFMDRFAASDRVRHLGVLTGDDLYAALCEIDIGLAPYDLALSNRGTTPNKLWHYLAVGKPVVVTDLPNIADWTFPPGCVYRAADETAFVDRVRQAHDEDGPDKQAARIAFARENTWEQRVKTLLDLTAG